MRVGAKIPKFKINYMVHVRRTGQIPKGSSKFTERLKVTKEVGAKTYMLSDGRKWNTPKLPLFSKDALTQNDSDSEVNFDKIEVLGNVHLNPSKLCLR